MSVHPRITRVATSWPGNFVVDDLVIPLVGAADPPLTAITGTLKSDLLSAVYTAALTLTFTAGTVQPGLTVVPSLELGTATPVEVAVQEINPTTQVIVVSFRTLAGGGASPPSIATNSKLVLAIFRPLPFR